MDRPKIIRISKDLANGTIVSKEIENTLEKILFATGANTIKLIDGTQYKLCRSCAYLTQSEDLDFTKKEVKDVPLLYYEYQKI